jgi:hypothetical protein
MLEHGPAYKSEGSRPLPITHEEVIQCLSGERKRRPWSLPGG